ncbi:unnamed protein product [Cuscuta epithymum]|uniref:Uncharacterized protein n=1 Tax=Cuscuta epithymum TaxID=186058 RepID=A0AAV0G537_9ASTE|nr:unnamed protein product [Cuscuta epithymum]
MHKIVKKIEDGILPKSREGPAQGTERQALNSRRRSRVRRAMPERTRKFQRLDGGAHGRERRPPPQELLWEIPHGIWPPLPPRRRREEGHPDPAGKERPVDGMGAHQGRVPGPVQDVPGKLFAPERRAAAVEEFDYP